MVGILCWLYIDLIFLFVFETESQYEALAALELTV